VRLVIAGWLGEVAREASMLRLGYVDWDTIDGMEPESRSHLAFGRGARLRRKADAA
jgi:hypothetical protein